MGQFLHAGVDGKLEVDSDALQFGQTTNEFAFFARAIEALNDPKQSELTRTLLARYVPEGPGLEATPERWRSWLEENKSYLFFSDAGGYRWYLDPLAKKRGLPSDKLHGTDRATLPGI